MALIPAPGIEAFSSSKVRAIAEAKPLFFIVACKINSGFNTLKFLNRRGNIKATPKVERKPIKHTIRITLGWYINTSLFKPITVKTTINNPQFTIVPREL